MTRATAVIGAGFGDEGKGRVTDALAAADPAAVVVRFNGGAQAGHTVVDPAGRRHVFSHVPAGALAGRRGHLSRFFTANPLLLDKELDELARLAIRPSVTIAPEAPVTTPFDMLINQIAEAARGAGRHGSCGVGYGETQERHTRSINPIAAADLHAPDLPDRLRAIRSDWMPRRLAELGVVREAAGWSEIIQDDGLIERFVASARRLAKVLALRPDRDLAREASVIFEGAQGLLLDQDLGWFPHVTRSHTGLPNAAALARDAGISEVSAIYVSRAYLTRHGAGPLPAAFPACPYPGISDPTNRPNLHQGQLRFAPLDIDLLSRAIARDLLRADGVTVTPEIALTCLDQVPGRLDVVTGRAAVTIDATTLPERTSRATGLPVERLFTGPGRGLSAEAA